MIGFDPYELGKDITEFKKQNGHTRNLAVNLLKESDRGCAILSAELLNDDLESLLRAVFRKEDESKKLVDSLFRSYAPLSTFSSRITMCYVSNLIPIDVYLALESLRKMRNKFAHERGVIDFKNEKIRDHYFNFTKFYPKIDADKIVETDNAKKPIIGGVVKNDMINRIAFGLCVVEVMTQIDYITDAIDKGAPYKEIVRAFELSDKQE